MVTPPKAVVSIIVFPLAATLKGSAFEEAAVAKERRYPVPVFDAVSVRLKRLVDAPVAAL